MIAALKLGAPPQKCLAFFPIMESPTLGKPIHTRGAYGMKFGSNLALAVLAASTTIAFADPAPTATGFWELRYDDGSPQGWFLVSQKDNVYSARLVKGFKKAGDDAAPQKICSECPGNKKGAQVMGLTLFYGLKRDGLSYRDGNVLDPRNGSVYNAKMYLSEDGKELKVRGYLGVETLGETKLWERLPADAMKAEDIPKEILAAAGGDKN